MPVPRSPNTEQGHSPPLQAGASARGRELLRNNPLFSHLDDGEVDAILAEARVVSYSEGAHIFAKGDPGDSMMAVLHGRVAISDPSSDGRQVLLTVFRDGDVFGEMALIDGKERSANATAAAACDLLVVPRQSFLRLLEHRPDVCLGLMIVLCDRLRRTNEQVEDFAFLGLERRIAKLLLHRLADEMDQTAALRLTIRISQRSLGELVGGSRERINKILHEWRRSGIIVMEHGSIQICDRQALTDLA
jgi:CRP/FNR family transcriptional regulator, cyclic AMP receptor protein